LEHVGFKAGVIRILQGVVNGRIGKVKTEASQDEVPLDPAFAHVLRDWKGKRTEGLVKIAALQITVVCRRIERLHLIQSRPLRRREKHLSMGSDLCGDVSLQTQHILCRIFESPCP
jgi:hypothetical protein